MTARPVTRARVARRVARYRPLLNLPELVLSTAQLDRAYGMAFTSVGGTVTILIDDKRPLDNAELDCTVLHELAHAENCRVNGTLRHDANWRGICRRLSQATGLKVT